MGPDDHQSSPQGQRTLAAIVFSDVVNYSGRMSRDEEHTLQLVKRDLDLMTRLCEQFEGRVLKFTGDGLLMYFTSAVQAVACALEVQKAIAAAAVDLPPEDELQHRIGIHLGDVFLSETDVMGDGVNIAARLQSEAEPGGICLSQIVYDVVKRRLALQATYLGPRELKHIQEAVPIYQIVMAAKATKTTDLSVEELSTQSNIPAPGATPSQTSTGLQSLPSELKKSLERALAEAIGPIASVVLSQALKQASNHQELLEKLMTHLPEHTRLSFRERAGRLLEQASRSAPEVPSPIKEAPSPSTERGQVIEPEISPFAEPVSGGAIDADFIKRCERELAMAIGPMASLILQRTLSQQPQLSRTQLIESLTKHLPNPETMKAFRQKLG